MPGDEVRVQMGEEDVADRETMLPGEGDVTIDVALGVDDRGDLGFFVGDQVGGMGEAPEIELLEDQRTIPFQLRERMSKRSVLGELLGARCQVPGASQRAWKAPASPLPPVLILRFGF